MHQENFCVDPQIVADYFRSKYVMRHPDIICLINEKIRWQITHNTTLNDIKKKKTDCTRKHCLYDRLSKDEREYVTRKCEV